MGSDVKIARALISVTDKTGDVDFARTLVDDFGVEIISTGGTARAIEDVMRSAIFCPRSIGSRAPVSVRPIGRIFIR